MDYFNLYKEVMNETNEKGIVKKPSPQRPLPRWNYTATQARDILGPTPEEALFFGADGEFFPVFLNLDDPSPGPIVVVGERLTGKRSFLMNIAVSCEVYTKRKPIQYAVISDNPGRWDYFGVNDAKNCVGIYGFYDNTAQDLVYGLCEYGKNNKNHKVILLLDTLKGVLQFDFDFQVAIKWLLKNGPNMGIWPVVSVHNDDVNMLSNYMEFFRTQIFAYIDRYELEEDEEMLSFWIPRLE